MILLVGGGLAVWLGAEGMVRGSVKLAGYLGVPSLIIGLTVVAFGTSAPELVVSSFASARGHGQIALGNVIGSNIINIGLVLGLSTLLAPISVGAQVLKRDVSVVVVVTLGVVVMAWIGGQVSRIDGIILLLGFATHTVMSYKLALKEQSRITTTPGWKRPELKSYHIGILIGGTIILAGGAEGMVKGAVGIAEDFGISKRIIGMTIVAFGTSVPELAASMVAAKHGEGDLALGNVVGSNLYNMLLILGTASVIRPVASNIAWPGIDFIFFIVFVLVLAPMIRMGWRLSRTDGFILLALYAIFNVLLFVL
ncbi:MAG: calcium/sodium antiporter [Deltaproteobacteria bacterium]|nr:calcium/sodium antiporter [Deltaproteobacteria bacterium]